MFSPCLRFVFASFSLSAIFAFSVQAAHAQVTEYTSRSSFDAGSTITSTEDFSGVAPTGGFVSYVPANTVTLGGFTFTQALNAANNDLSVISSSYYGTIGSSYNLGNGDFLQAGYGNPSQLTILLPSGTTAFGLDVGTFAGPGGQVTATLSNGTNFVFGNIYPDVSFFGFTSATAITSLTLMDQADGAANNTLNIDTLEAGRAAPAAVPEASTTVSFGLLLMLGLGGIAVAAKRKQGAAQA